MGDPGETHCPVVPPLNPEGAIVGAPATAKSDPVKSGPPLLRSIVPPPVQPAPPVVAAAQPELFEFTTMPRTGPPTTATVALPLTSRAWPPVAVQGCIFAWGGRGQACAIKIRAHRKSAHRGTLDGVQHIHRTGPASRVRRVLSCLSVKPQIAHVRRKGEKTNQDRGHGEGNERGDLAIVPV